MITLDKYYITILFCLTCLFICGPAVAADIGPDEGNDTKTAEADKTRETGTKASETQWNLGIGLGTFNYHYYPGAKERNQIFLPAPYFTYKSPKFEVDRGIKSFLYNTEEIIIDISADFGLPVDSDDTVARTGMPDLDFVVQLGPSIEFMLNDRRKNYFDTRFEIPLRIAFTVDIGNMDHIGYLVEPRFTFSHRRSANTGLSHKATMGLKFATSDYHAYYYDVAPQYATPDRPGYVSDSGFGGGFVNYRLSYKTSDFIYWAFFRYQSLRGAEFEDSPLVVQNDYYFFGIGFAWIFAQSL